MLNMAFCNDKRDSLTLKIHQIDMDKMRIFFLQLSYNQYFLQIYG